MVIIGGGIIGLSTAYHLGRLGCRDVVLLERNELTSGTSWHAAGIVGPLRSSMNLTKLSIYATELFASLEAETGQATGYRRTGGLWLAQSSARLVELQRIAAMGELTGLRAAMLSAAECASRLPLLRVDDLCGGLWVDEDGQTNPVDTCMAYARGARQRGVRILERTAVTAIHSVAGAVHSIETADGGRIRCESVVNCAGAWARQVGALAGVAVPLQAVEHMYVVTEPLPGLPAPFPIVRDLDGGIYVKEDAGKLVLGGFEHDAKLWHPAADGADPGYLMLPQDWEQFEPFLKAGLNRLPAMGSVGIRHFMNGPESFTPDTRQLMGEVPGLRNFYIAAGFNSIGIVSSAGAGRAMAEWIVAGEPPMDLWDVDIARMDTSMTTSTFLERRIPESVANQFDMHWPYKQPTTGRGLRLSALHDALTAKGAVFGAPAGWERPLWYAAGPAERDLPYSFEAQPWWPAAEREAQTLSERVGLVELSPFTKIEIDGADAGRYLQWLCAADVGGPAGALTYTQLLNRRGGIEADVTVARIDDARFWLISGAATRTKDLMWLRRAAAAYRNLTITDVTADYAVIGVMGPRARELLAGLTCAELAGPAFPFATSRAIEVAGAAVRATRVSYVGELGWELYVPVAAATAVHGALCAAGARFGLGHVGLYCVEACRIEKGYRHWGHDIGPDDSPLESGLGFAVDFDKGSDFLGRDALLRQREAGVSRHLLLLAVEGAMPLLLHDEPVYCAGEIVGRTTSGARGFRTGRSLCFAYVSCAPGTTRRDLLGRDYEIGVAGERHRLQALPRAPYDPAGLRLRG